MNGINQTWKNLVMAWYQEITEVGSAHGVFCVEGHCDDAFAKGGEQINGEIFNSLFADSDLEVAPWGKDCSPPGEGQCSHGGLARSGRSGDFSIYIGSMRLDEPGPGDCELTMDEMRLGNDGLDFLHFSSCHSMDDEQWSIWTEVYAGVHQIDGFPRFHAPQRLAGSRLREFRLRRFLHVDCRRVGRQHVQTPHRAGRAGR